MAVCYILDLFERYGFCVVCVCWRYCHETDVSLIGFVIGATSDFPGVYALRGDGVHACLGESAVQLTFAL